MPPTVGPQVTSRRARREERRGEGCPPPSVLRSRAVVLGDVLALLSQLGSSVPIWDTKATKGPRDALRDTRRGATPARDGSPPKFAPEDRREWVGFYPRSSGHCRRCGTGDELILRSRHRARDHFAADALGASADATPLRTSPSGARGTRLRYAKESCRRPGTRWG